MTTQAQQHGRSSVREGIGERELTTTSETTSSALAVQAEADVKARYAMAVHRPRSVDQARLDLLAECKRPRFAEVSRYHLPKGKCKVCKGRGAIGRDSCAKCDGTGENIVEGFTIGFAKAAARCWKNVYADAPTIAETATQRIVRVRVTDLESNVTFSQDVIVDKTVERRELKEGQGCLGTRRNSYGDLVYLMPATEDDLRAKQGGMISRVQRNGVLSLIPGDILDEALEEVTRTLTSEVNRDPKAERNRIVDAFASVGVKPADLVTYVGHELDGLTTPELLDLRKLFAGLKGGDVTWREVMEARKADEDPETKPSEESAAPAKGTAALKEKLKRAEEKKAATPASAPAEAAKMTPVAPTMKPAPAPTEPADRPSTPEQRGKFVEACTKAFGLAVDPAKKLHELIGISVEKLEDATEKEISAGTAEVERAIVAAAEKAKNGKK